MNEQLFRKKSIDRVSSPEQLNDYIRVSNPAIWMVLAAVVILLVGICVWGIVGNLDTTVTVAAVAENGTVTLYVKEADAASVTEGMTVRINGEEYTVGTAGAQPFAVDESLSDYALHVGELSEGEWVYAVTVNGVLPDGVYSAEIVIESVSPISFVLN